MTARRTRDTIRVPGAALVELLIQHMHGEKEVVATIVGEWPARLQMSIEIDESYAADLERFFADVRRRVQGQGPAPLPPADDDRDPDEEDTQP